VKAGRELDALVAEKVMGWKRGGDDSYCSPEHVDAIVDDWDSKGPHPCLVSPRGKIYYFCPCQERKGYELPHYSSDIAAAWTLAEKLNISVLCSADGWYAGETADIAHGDWCKEVFVKGDWTLADTAPLAICKAALKTKGIDVGREG
jgi:hypothetical protein